jgi:hypothetical protein
VSKTETPMIRRYWEMVGGTLIEEFPVVVCNSDARPTHLPTISIPISGHECFLEHRHRIRKLRQHCLDVPIWWRTSGSRWHLNNSPNHLF